MRSPLPISTTVTCFPLDAENDAAMVWADSADQSKLVGSLLKTAGHGRRIQDQGSRHHPLKAAAKERNREYAKTSAKMEHVFGQMEMAMGGRLTRWMG